MFQDKLHINDIMNVELNGISVCGYNPVCNKTIVLKHKVIENNISTRVGMDNRKIQIINTLFGKLSVTFRHLHQTCRITKETS